MHGLSSALDRSGWHHTGGVDKRQTTLNFCTSSNDYHRNMICLFLYLFPRKSHHVEKWPGQPQRRGVAGRKCDLGLSPKAKKHAAPPRPSSTSGCGSVPLRENRTPLSSWTDPLRTSPDHFGENDARRMHSAIVSRLRLRRSE